MVTSRHPYFWSSLSICAALAGWLTYPVSAAQEADVTWVQPRDFGLDIPPGTPSAGNDEPVLTVDNAGNPVVGQMCVRVGGHGVVLLPSGELVARPADQVQPTDRKFVPLTVDELLKHYAAGPLADMTIRKTRHYVYAFNTSEEFATLSSRTLETMIPGILRYAKQQKIPAHEPETPLVAVMFRTREQFDKYQRMPDGVVAYYHVLSNQVVMYEQSPLWKIKPELALQQSIATIAHEGAHQILHNVGVQQRLSRWPMWWSEGMAEYFSPTSFGRNLSWKGPGKVNDLRMFEIEMYLKGRSAEEPKGQMIEQTVSAARLTSTGYALAWSLTHYLARHEREAFDEFARELSKQGPLQGSGEVVQPGIVPSQLTLFQRHFGSDLATLETELVKHLHEVPYTDPFMEWPHFVATLEYAQGRRSRREANLFHSPDMAQKWLQETIASLPADQRATARQKVVEFPNRGAADRFARQFLGSK